MNGKARIGFIGVGLMGHGMAKNLVEKGHPLTVIAHRKREAVEDLKTRGAAEARDLAALVQASDVIVLCVTAASDVEANIAAMRAHLRRGQMILDASTSQPDVTQRLAGELAAQGVALCDIPLTRGPAQAWEGQLGCLFGGDDAAFARAKPIIECFAVNLVRCGPVGSAHAVKLINNFIAIGYLAVWAEAYATAVQARVDPKALHAIISSGGLNCLNFQAFSKNPLEGIKDAHKFTIANCLKDMRYYAELAENAGGARLISDSVLEFAKLSVAQGFGDAYMASFFDAYLHLHGTTKQA